MRAQPANAIRLLFEKILDPFSLGIGINNLKSACAGGLRVHVLAEMKNARRANCPPFQNQMVDGSDATRLLSRVSSSAKVLMTSSHRGGSWKNISRMAA